MRLGAVVLARRLARRRGPPPDVVLASSYVDLAALRGLWPRPWWRVPALLYLQENQLTYPLGEGELRDHAYGFQHLQACLAADRVLFNSRDHREGFLAALEALLGGLSERAPRGLVRAVRARSGVLYPGAEVARLRRAALPLRHARPRGPAVFAWPHRWEWDKAPEVMVAALGEVAALGLDFRLVVLAREPEGGPGLPPALGRRVLRFREATGREDYVRALAGADAVVSTARQETFGFATVEAMACGCLPVLPDRLSYPELLSPARAGCLYRGPGGLRRALARIARHPEIVRGADSAAAAAAVARFDWGRVAPRWDAVLSRIAGRQVSPPVAPIV